MGNVNSCNKRCRNCKNRMQMQQLVQTPSKRTSPDTVLPFIRNLKYDQTESTDSNITKNKVNRLILDGLKLTDIEMLISERKQTRDGRPGILIVTFATAEQKSSVMKQKKDLRKNKNESVYLEDERPPGQRLNESNMRTLLKACGKSGDYIFSNGRLFQKRKQQQ